ncbi:class I SAM-dependent methyltransferase [Amycolatopsis sp. H20-H5]|uniref:class I SAM-dependent methyltransferase n=1 Tax=Amycolatopsis sp. H20-H5 TaxID=3046309 RepID=UPI002DB85E59|nr:class I SAM-dependent methyltransferase [Amycolatopsis sp. H20-H5]MEC3975244.1 class I SAM-dependent methyltransferase [Amycolatopsis sp. H20-H5]
MNTETTITVQSTSDNQTRQFNWLSAEGSPPPTHVVAVDDRLTADKAQQWAAQGTAMAWEGDFQNARQLLSALARRVAGTQDQPSGSPAETFHRYREQRSHRARVLRNLLVPLGPGHVLSLRRAPDVRQACTEVYGASSTTSLVPLRELLGVIGAHEWREKGVQVPALGERVHAHYGVFSPVRGEYVDLVAEAPLPARTLAFDLGTGTGVLAAVLARRGVERVVATDVDPAAIACAKDNFARLGLSERCETVRTDLFPPGRAPLVVCNPPWVPARPHAPLERAVYDPGSRMLRSFLDRLGAHLEPGGEGWLVLSDFAERLELRTRDELLKAFADAGLRVLDRLDTRPGHPATADETDPLHAARAAEITSLWRLSPN